MVSESRLSAVLSEFAGTMGTDFSIQSILDHLVERIVDVLPISAAGVTHISSEGDAHYVAASDPRALRFEKLQTDLGEGPCHAAYRTGDAVAIADLRCESRFTRFVPHALDAGLEAVFAFPLRHRDERLGVLDLYRETAGSLSDDAMSAAQTLADVAAAYLLNARARGDLRASSARSRATALHDGLTGLPNRALLLERLDHAVLRARRSGKMAAVLFTDLDGFKMVNDTHGHSVGDELLVAVARRLTARLRSGDTLARMSGDEFVILCEDLNEPSEVSVIAARICAAIEEPFVLSSGEMLMTTSVGIAYAGRGDELSADLLQDADTAMYQAKRKGGAGHQIVDLREQRIAEQRAELEHDLTGATARGELRSVYQPIVVTGDGHVVGIETFLRWARPSCEMVMPNELLPIAEQSGLIIEIGRWILEQACQEQKRWQDHEPTDRLTVSINVSAQQLMSADFTATVAGVLSETGADPCRVTLELNESVFIQDGERALVVLAALKRLGVLLALDDFGTGCSSLSYLKDFPIDIVKIDHAFIADLDTDRASHAIVSAIIKLSHELDMTVIAEGVETAEQHKKLVALDCDYCQGYYFARPMPPRDFAALCDATSVASLPLPVVVTSANA
jgi:diguanylate cyclase (GGDEF)-like protein